MATSVDAADPYPTPNIPHLSPSVVVGIAAGILIPIGFLFLLAAALAYKRGWCYPVWKRNAGRDAHDPHEGILDLQAATRC
ncbi:hypothetical protein F5Y14DRAFT_457360 [Nemania sp. NC0429]|nr:hypothetical protein F5Y14DRAFT_457360 [Nemania sp. NC0429]